MNALELRRRVLMMAQKKSRLPSEYQEVEYLESTGTQYIRTNYYPLSGVSLSTEAYISTSSQSGYIFSAGSVQYSNLGVTPAVGMQGIYYCYFTKVALADRSSTNYHDRWISISITSIGQLYIDKKFVFADHATANDTDGELMLFQSKNGLSTERATVTGKAKSFIVERNNITELELIPCYRKSDHKPGMYDLVSKTLFTNAGTGEFIVGADVN